METISNKLEIEEKLGKEFKKIEGIKAKLKVYKRIKLNCQDSIKEGIADGNVERSYLETLNEVQKLNTQKATSELNIQTLENLKKYDKTKNFNELDEAINFQYEVSELNKDYINKSMKGGQK